MSKILFLLTFNLIYLSSCLTTDNMHESSTEVVSAKQDSTYLDIKTQNNELLKEKQIQLGLLRKELTGSVKELQDKIQDELITLMNNPNSEHHFKHLSINMTIILTTLKKSSQMEDSNHSTYEVLSIFYNKFYFSIFNNEYQGEVFEDTNNQIKHMIGLLEADIRNLTEINNLLEKTDSIE